jgi:hypothetical protein
MGKRAMRMDIDTRLVSTVRTSKDQMVLTFQVINPSINYTVGEKYTLAEALFEMANRQSSARRTGARSGIASQAGQAVKKSEQRGRPTNKERIRRYIAEHGGTAEQAARVLHIKQ